MSHYLLKGVNALRFWSLWGVVGLPHLPEHATDGLTKDILSKGKKLREGLTKLRTFKMQIGMFTVKERG